MRDHGAIAEAACPTRTSEAGRVMCGADGSGAGGSGAGMSHAANTSAVPITGQSSAAARAKILTAQRIVIKVGTSVVSSKSGHLALGRMGAIIEQICRLVRSGKQVRGGGVFISWCSVVTTPLVCRSFSCHPEPLASDAGV